MLLEELTRPAIALSPKAIVEPVASAKELSSSHLSMVRQNVAFMASHSLPATLYTTRSPSDPPTRRCIGDSADASVRNRGFSKSMNPLVPQCMTLALIHAGDSSESRCQSKFALMYSGATVFCETVPFIVMLSGSVCCAQAQASRVAAAIEARDMFATRTINQSNKQTKTSCNK